MTNCFFANRARILAFFVCLLMSTACICAFFSTPAVSSPLPESNVSGSCTWEYKEDPDRGLVLTIAPAQGEEGTLASAPPPFSHWHSKWRRVVKHVVVEGKVKVGASAYRMFSGFKEAKSMDLRGLDVTNVPNMGAMFDDCPALVEVDTRGWDTSSVTDMKGMFQNCYALTSVVGIENWNTHKVADMSDMFSCCHALRSLDLSGWDTRAAEHKQRMFFNVELLEDITLGENTQIDEANFESAGSCVGSHWVRTGTGASENPLDNVVDPVQDDKRVGRPVHYKRLAITKGASGDCIWEYIPLTDAQGNVIKDAGGNETYKLKICPFPHQNSGTLKNWDARSEVPWSQSLSETYRRQTTRIEIPKVKGERAVNAQTCQGMFCGFHKLKTADISGLSTAGVKDMSWMFGMCHALVSLDLSGCDVSEAINMERMFFQCYALASLDLSGWSTRTLNAPKMEGMFGRTYSLEAIILGDNFHFGDDTMFDDAGAWVGTHWAQVIGGTNENSEAHVISNLVEFHHDDSRQKRQTNGEQYIRKIPKLPANGCKETGHDPDGWKETGYDSDGCKDAEGDSHVDGQSSNNAMPAVNAQKPRRTQWMLKTYKGTSDVNVLDEVEVGVEPSELILEEPDVQAQVSDNVLSCEGNADEVGGAAENTARHRPLPVRWECVEVSIDEEDREPGKDGTERPAQNNDDEAVASTSAVEPADADVTTFDGNALEETVTEEDLPNPSSHEHDTQDQMPGNVLSSEGAERRVKRSAQQGDEENVDEAGGVPENDASDMTPHVQRENARVSVHEATRPVDREASNTYSSGWHRKDGAIFYYKDRKKATGWQELSGTIQNPSSPEKNWFYFDDAGVMLTGRHRLVGGFKNAQGAHEENWFYFDDVTGIEIRGWHRIIEDGVENWYYYRDGDGIMLKGRHKLMGGFKNAQGAHEENWFYFDDVTGIEIRGWHRIIEDGVENWYYYRDGDGIMLKGRHKLMGGFKNAQGAHEENWFYFDDVTGIEIRGWHRIIEDGVENWYYYRDGDGIMLKGQHELVGGFNQRKNWFYFDRITGIELRNCWKHIPSQNKICHYGSDGAMYKGWHVINHKPYYFDLATGARH